MQGAVDQLAARFGQQASILITYSDGVNTIAGIPATPERTPYEAMEGNVIVLHESRDYIFPASYLAQAKPSPIVEPARGHTITEPDGTKYDVMRIKGENAYERIGPNRTVLKIHTKGPM
jgi:hypothetical protein